MLSSPPPAPPPEKHLDEDLDIEHEKLDDEPHVNGVLTDSKLAFLPLHSLSTTKLSHTPTSPTSPTPSSCKSNKSDKHPPPEHVHSLVDALAHARKEMELKATRVADLEELLAQERRAREQAEERAAQLENASRVMRGKSREMLLREVELERKRETSSAEKPEKEADKTPRRKLRKLLPPLHPTLKPTRREWRA